MNGYEVWGWGGPADAPSTADLEALAPLLEQTTGVPALPVLATAPVPELPASRRLGDLPSSLRDLASADPARRARHGIGRSYRDLVRGMRGALTDVPDLVLTPRTEQDVADVLDWATSSGVPVVPFGGGTSVVGGVEPRDLDGAVSLDLGALSGVVEVDVISRAVRVRAGTLGPDLETALKPHGLTLRFYPQSFERSSVGGWLATRAAGHFSTGPTHIDDLVQSIRALTPVGPWESRRLPASGAGPSPDRLLLGSEGTLGVITEAWLRVQPRPTRRWSATLAAPDFSRGANAVRGLVQAGLAPATCRLIDPAESHLTGTLTTGEAALVLGFESVHAELGDRTSAALEICATPGCAPWSPASAPAGATPGGPASCELPTCASSCSCSASSSRRSRQPSPGTGSTASWPRCGPASPMPWSGSAAAGASPAG